MILSRALPLLLLAAANSLLLAEVPTSTPAATSAPSQAKLIADVPYTSPPGNAQRLDIRIPMTPPPKDGYPIFIIVHGGGWGSGDKAKDISIFFGPLAAKSFLVVSINYRLAPEHRWPACIEDTKAALAWTKAHVRAYNGNPDRLAVAGYSAGGQLAFLTALAADDASRPNAVVGIAPVTDLLQDLPKRGGLSTALQNLLDRPKEPTPEALAIMKELSPINHLATSHKMPFLLLQGDADKTVPPEQSANFQKRCAELGIGCDLVSLKNCPHNIAQWDKNDPSYAKALLDWLETALPDSP